MSLLKQSYVEIWVNEWHIEMGLCGFVHHSLISWCVSSVGRATERKSGLPGRDVGSIPTRAHFFIVYSFHLGRSQIFKRVKMLIATRISVSLNVT